MVADPAAASHAGFDPAARYLWAPDIAALPRGTTAVQLGIEPPRQVLISGVTAHAVTVLLSLREPRSLTEVVSVLGGGPVWRALFDRLTALGLLVRAKAGADHRVAGVTEPLAAERLALIYEHGPAAADRLLARRSDAVVVIEGLEATALAVGELLDASGIGRVYRPARASAPSPQAEPLTGPPSVVRPRGPSRILPRHPPAHMPPDLVVLIGADPPSAGHAAELVASLQPHLAVRPSTPRGVVGPLVLPGRTACLNCLEKHRSDSDPLGSAVRGGAAAPAPLMTQSVAGLAARQVLDWIDGIRRPASAGATLEFAAGQVIPSRRSWSRHPACGCQWAGAR